MKVLRTTITIEHELVVYIPDPHDGVAEISVDFYQQYLDALTTVAAFELEVDRQYENQSASSTPQTG